MEGVNLEGGLRTVHGTGTGRNKVLKPNCFIVAGLFYFIKFGVYFSLLRNRWQVKGWGAMDIRGTEGVDLGRVENLVLRTREGMKY